MHLLKWITFIGIHLLLLADPFTPALSRLLWVAVFRSVMQIGRFTLSIQWILELPGSTLFPSASLLTPAVVVRCPSRLSSSLLRAGRGLSILYPTAWLTSESS